MNATRGKRAGTRTARIAGIGKDAAALGVSREHLRLVIQKKRTSHSLLARYQNLKRQTPPGAPMARIETQ